MNKTISIKEFDTIISNENYKDDSRYTFIDKKRFDDLITFIHEFTSNNDNADILDFLRIGYKRNVGSTITFKNYVGIIQMRDGYQLEILPKIDLSEDEDSKKTKNIFINMLRSMKDFPSKIFTNANLHVDKMNLYEIFINMYIQEVIQLVKTGIKSSYVNQEENLSYFKGKLIVNKQLRNNIIHKERFYVSYDEFLSNIPENKIVKATLEKLKRLTNHAINIKNINQLLLHFETVDASINYTKDFERIVVNRNNKEYSTLLEWSKVFLYNKSFSTFSGSTSSRALLFPMESVYESYIAQQIKKYVVPLGWNVSTQDRKYWLFMEPNKQFSLRPDIVLTKDDRTIIMDTKWKNLINNKRANYGISQSDMYQMYAYSKKYNTSEIWLLYPMNNEMRNHDPISFDSGDGTTVNIWFVNLDEINDNLNRLIKILG